MCVCPIHVGQNNRTLQYLRFLDKEPFLTDT